MRLLALATFAIGTIAAAAPAPAQTYAPDYPVCLHGPAPFFELIRVQVPEPVIASESQINTAGQGSAWTKNCEPFVLSMRVQRLRQELEATLKRDGRSATAQAFAS